jgi:hypothetical protein
VPTNGSNVNIESGWNMTMDVADGPELRLVRINGILRFKNDMNITFRAKHIFVRAGELLIGTKEKPHNGTCEIILYGEKNARAIVYDNAIEAGNKLIANLNVMRIYGKRRSHLMTRLHKEALKGDNEILIGKGMDLVPGDRLALLPTSFENTASDDVFVETYDIVTGKTVLNRELDFYHYGAEQSTADEYNGADIRGEVVLLTRNVVIKGQDIESWGG